VCEWSNVAVGSYRLTAKAADTIGGTGESPGVGVLATASGLREACRMRIDLPGYTQAETLTNFPVLVVLGTNRGGFAYSQFISDNGWDLRFTASYDVTELPYEIEKWNPNGASYVWVRVPALTSSAWLTATWGATNRATQPVYTTNGAVWAAGYAGVWHFAETSGAVARDATVYRRDGILNNGQNSDWGIGRAGGGILLEGGNPNSSYVSVGSVGNSVGISGNNTRTIYGWARARSATQQSWADVFGFRGGNGAYPFFDIEADDGSRYCLHRYGNDWDYMNVDTHWRFFAASHDGSNFRMYLDGVLVNTINDGPQSTVDNFGMGHREDGNGYFNGYVDEVRVTGAVRSSNWIWACYQTMASNDTFCAYGAVQAEGDADGDGILDSVDPDDDNDGMSDVDEAVAGTIPTNAASVLRISEFEIRYPQSEFVIRWLSVSDRWYTLQAATNLLTGFAPVDGASNIPATYPVNVYTDDTATLRQKFYRIKVGE
jgi:hypothetical protein